MENRTTNPVLLESAVGSIVGATDGVDAMVARWPHAQTQASAPRPLTLESLGVLRTRLERTRSELGATENQNLIKLGLSYQNIFLPMKNYDFITNKNRRLFLIIPSRFIDGRFEGSTAVQSCV